MQINGVAHTFITAGNFAAARAFYGQLLPFMGLTIVADTVNSFYCVGGRTGFGIHAPAKEYAGQRFRQGSVGLHHHCFRARERADVAPADKVTGTGHERRSEDRPVASGLPP